MRLASLFGAVLKVSACLASVCFLVAPHRTLAQLTPAGDAGQDAGSSPDHSASHGDHASADDQQLTLFPHSNANRYWISGQANFILQWHPDFPAKYSGPNSLHNAGENATSQVYTLYLGYELTPTADVFIDFESAGGRGISDALGLAGFTNLDVVRNPALGASPYVARVLLRQIVPLSRDRIEASRDALHLATSLPARRIEFRIGKFGLPDFVDLNAWGTDSHLQFLNWTVDNNGAYDYAANTRGYTDGAIVEYDDRQFAVRFVEALMPKEANGIHLDADLARARAENLEFEFHATPFAGRRTTVRLLSYLNHADMGNYREAIADFLAGSGSQPDIIATRRQGRHKYGFAMNFEQELTPDLGLFGRLGWSDGRNESFAYTEVDRTLELGAFTLGTHWHRRNDRFGGVFVANGIVAAHRQYLALGGLGFLLGDGHLTYGPEKILETFYTAHLWRGLFGSLDLQHINNPGYNKDRGPVLVPSFRFHVDM